MKIRRMVLTALILFVLPSVAVASRSVTLPWTMNFDDNSWVGDLSLKECGGTSTHTTSGCFSGGCMKITPPSSACTGGGINGGQTGHGWVNYASTSTLHVRFLIKFGPKYAANVRNGGGGLINKFLLSDDPSRVSILGFNCSDTAGRYCAWAVLDSSEVYHFRTPPNRGWIEDAVFRLSSTSYINQWIAVEYALNTSTGIGQLYLWTQDGQFEGILIDNVPIERSVGMRGFYMSYYNSYSTADPENYYMMDNLVVSNSFIGPPNGFVSSEVQPPAGLRIVN